MKHLLILFLLFVSCLAVGKEREKLLEGLEKINNLHRAISNERAEWQEEKKTLELHLQLVKDSLKNRSASKYELEKSLTDLKKKKSELTVKAETIEKALSDLKIISQKSSAQMLKNIQPKVPQSLQVLVQQETEELESLLVDEDANVMDVLSASREYFSSVLELQKKVHLLKEIVEVGGTKQQVTALYIGTFGGYYITQDTKSAGQLIYDGKWQAKANNSLLESVQKAISQYNREGKPVLVSLPVSGGTK